MFCVLLPALVLSLRIGSPNLHCSFCWNWNFLLDRNLFVIWSGCREIETVFDYLGHLENFRNYLFSFCFFVQKKRHLPRIVCRRRNEKPRENKMIARPGPWMMDSRDLLTSVSCFIIDVGLYSCQRFVDCSFKSSCGIFLAWHPIRLTIWLTMASKMRSNCKSLLGLLSCQGRIAKMDSVLRDSQAETSGLDD